MENQEAIIDKDKEISDEVRQTNELVVKNSDKKVLLINCAKQCFEKGSNLFWQPAVFFSLFYLSIALIIGLGLTIKNNLSLTNLYDDSSLQTNNETINKLNKKSASFIINNMMKFDLINNTHFKLNTYDANLFDEKLNELFKNLFSNDTIYDRVTFFNTTTDSSMIIGADLTLIYDENDEAQNSRDYMIHKITDKLRNITSNDLKDLIITDVILNPNLLLNELEIKNEFCTEYKSQLNDTINLYSDNKTCLQCSFNSNGTQFKYCNKTITLINTPL